MKNREGHPAALELQNAHLVKFSRAYNNCITFYSSQNPPLP